MDSNLPVARRPARSPLRERKRVISPLRDAFPKADKRLSPIQSEGDISQAIVGMYRSAALESSPLAIAAEIELLIRSILLSTNGYSSTSEEPPFVLSPNGHPVFPDEAKMVKDESLLSLLADTAVMNGTQTTGQDGKMGVFNALQVISEKQKSTDVMFDVPVDFGEPNVNSPVSTTKLKKKRKRFSLFSMLYLSPSLIPSEPPSETKLSCEIMWWGYRLYLPPPVVAYLSEKTMSFSKRAKAISSILSWVLQFIPIAVLPPEAQAIVMLLQKIAPFVGYIGTFVSWMWGEVLSYDKGNGVTLTATWLLPVALIPGTLGLEKPPTSPEPVRSKLPPKSPESDKENEVDEKWWGLLGHGGT